MPHGTLLDFQFSSLRSQTVRPGESMRSPCPGTLGTPFTFTLLPLFSRKWWLGSSLTKAGVYWWQASCPSRAGSLSPREGQGTFPSTSRAHPFAGHQPGSGRPSQPLPFQASRVDTVVSALLSQGFSAESAERVVRGHKGATERQYQVAWTSFLAFLGRRNITSSQVNLPVVCDFLNDLCVSVERKYRTIATYRSALRHPLLFACGLDLDTEASRLFMRGVFNYRPPVKASPVPAWSLNRLLRFLTSPPFEPLRAASVLRLSQKFLFLLLLASGRRIDEVSPRSPLLA